MNQELFDKGLKVRREVLGAEYVDKSIASADDFNRPMQELVTEYCWGEIWNRPGLDRKTRSIINLSMLTALNRPHEIKLHVLGAINNGLTKDDIKEVILKYKLDKRYGISEVLGNGSFGFVFGGHTEDEDLAIKLNVCGPAAQKDRCPENTVLNKLKSANVEGVIDFK